MSHSVVEKMEYRAFITGLPCFAMLVPEECVELVSLMKVETYPEGKVIVAEDDLVDRVYIIITGHAEVTRRVIVQKGLKKVTMESPIAVISFGDAIGLNDTGFFSKTGKRTATVTALRETTVLALDLKELHLFLKKYPHVSSDMLAASSQMLRVQLIKQSLPFVHLSYERIKNLASKIGEISVPAGTIIFKQGDVGDKCYLICSGRVEILRTNAAGVEESLATLKSPAIFGEATLITRTSRNATARTVDDCELLDLNHEYLSELMESEANVARMFMNLMVDRSCPLKNPNVSEHPRETEDGQIVVILKNSDSGKYFKLSKEGQFIWDQLNGNNSMQAITMALSHQYNLFAPDVVAALISKLARAGFVTNVHIADETETAKKTKLQRSFGLISRCLNVRFAFGDSDKWITKIYQKFVHYIFTKMARRIINFAAIVGLIAFLASTHSTIETFNILPNIWVLFLLLIPATVFSVALHELGHAFATKAYGYEVHYMGVGWFWFGPVAFTDTSDMWLSTKGPRIAVNMAGIYTDILIAGLSGLMILLVSNPYIQAFFWVFALFTYLNAFRMLSPLQELDGYYVLMDLVDKPQLRQSAVLWLVNAFPKCLHHPTLFKQNKPELYYWLACLIYLIVTSVVTLFVVSFVLKSLGMHTNPYYSLAIPFIVVIISSLNVIREVKSA